MQVRYISGIDGTEKIRRYMSMKKFERLVRQGMHYFPAMTSFEDQLEGGLHTITPYLLEYERVLLDVAMNQMWPSNDRSRAECRDAVPKVSLSTVFGKYLTSSIEENSALLAWQKDNLFVSCWDSSEIERLEMWKIYGRDRCEGACDESRAVCIETTVGKLVGSLSLSSGFELRAAKVEYFYPDSFQYERDIPLAPFLAKHYCYGFEREIRFVYFDSSVEPLSEQEKLHGRLIENTELGIDKVVVSPLGGLCFFEEVREICEPLGLAVVESELYGAFKKNT
ncbi:hypothetical protein ICA16_14995 [Pseudomonas anatoliensis]|uniref:hypothetical protein n=1 Tax=Pseudomonas anatoliensis TaxID=2710589 RepID=UPI001B322D33|nr:hypothetical protein [Pseudomonas anatoliensis]MBP5956977.1 hypothetical protein [Pseudomonas anatoliensis]